MNTKIILAIALFCINPAIYCQNNYSISAELGVVTSYGTAGGLEIGIRKVINENFGFKFTAGLYSWGKKDDLNAIYMIPADYDTHVRREMGMLIPFRAGFNYKFGNLKSHPYLSVEWGINYITNNFYNPINGDGNGNSTNKTFAKSGRNTLFASLGFSLGYSYNLNDDINIVSGVNWQSGYFAQIVGFVSGIEYQF